MDDPDVQFFKQHPDRRARIRVPGKVAYKNKQRAVQILDESEIEFRSLGPHHFSRRRIVVYRTPSDHPSHPNHLIKIPFLLYADETVEDRDDILMPLVHQVMERERKKGMQ